MPTPVHVPRVNNNDDTVLVVQLNVGEGDRVERGQVIGSVETDKAVMDVEAEADGIVLKVLHRVQDVARVGSVLLWLGQQADEPVPEDEAPGAQMAGEAGRATAKARAMLKELGLTPEQVPASGERLTVADVQAWLEHRGQPRAMPVAPPAKAVERAPEVAGDYHDLAAEANGMLNTVLWHRDHVAAGYIETEYDPKPWDEHAKQYADTHKLMLPPLLPLLAFRLVQIARERPAINATMVGNRRYQYSPVNLGFTVQAGQTLYLTVIRDAQAMDTARFVSAMGEAQRRAMAHRLNATELSGATVSLSSMARWNVSRHVPILPPMTSLIVAHAASRGADRAVLGASYDHRLLSGFEVVQVLQALARPAG